MMSISSIEALRGKAFAAQSLVERTELPFATHPLAPTLPYSRIAHDVRPTSCFIGLLAVPIQSRTLIRALTAFHCIPRGHGRQDPARNRIQVRWRAQRWRRVGSRVLWLCSQFLDFIFGPCEHAIDRRLYSAHDAVDDMAHRGACVCLVFGGCGRRRLCGRWRLGTLLWPCFFFGILRRRCIEGRGPHCLRCVRINGFRLHVDARVPVEVADLGLVCRTTGNCCVKLGRLSQGEERAC